MKSSVRFIWSSREATATYLELILISISLLVSLLVSLMFSQRDRILTRGIRSSRYLTTLGLALVFTTFGMMATVLILAWMPLLSVDALAAIVFALIPGLLNLPVDLLHDELFRIVRRSYPSLNISDEDLCYVCIGEKACGKQYEKGGWLTPFHNLNDQVICLDKRCGAHVFIRYRPEECSSSGRFFRMQHQSECYSFSSRPIAGCRTPIRSIAFPCTETTQTNARLARVQDGDMINSHQEVCVSDVALSVVEHRGQPPVAVLNQRPNDALISVAVDRGANAEASKRASEAAVCTSRMSFGRRTPTSPRTIPKDKQALPGDVQWCGKRIGHTSHCVQLADMKDGMIVWWWNAIMAASSLVAFPEYVRLQHRNQVLKALSLLSDIVRVGDFILEYRRSFFEWLLMNDVDLKRGLISTPAFLCNSIIRRIPLAEWNEVSNIDADDFKFPRVRSDEYALIFYMLTEQSQLFSLPKQAKSSANVIIEELLKAEFTSRMEFDRSARRWVDDWLCAWGVRCEVLKNFDDMMNTASDNRTR